jgi:hypothetical protein
MIGAAETKFKMPDKTVKATRVTAPQELEVQNRFRALSDDVEARGLQ